MTVLSAKQRLACPAARSLPPEPRADKGFGIMEWGGVALAIILVLAIVLVGLRTLSSRTDTGSELTNIQTIIASTRGMMRASGGYGTGDLTPTLIKAGGVSRSMSTDANKNKLYNTWGVTSSSRGQGPTVLPSLMPKSRRKPA